MKRLLVSFFLIAFTVLSFQLQAGGEPEQGESQKRYGPFEAISFNASVLRDVKYVAEGNNVYLQLLPDHKDKEIVVKLSNGYFASYREWSHGGYELVSPANQGKAPYAWTDHVNTSASYIEYWMDGEVFLHLKRVN